MPHARRASRAMLVGYLPCRTAACGHERADYEGENGPTEVWRIGSVVRMVCQRCRGCWALTPRQLEQVRD